MRISTRTLRTATILFTTSAITTIIAPQSAWAGCIATPTANDDIYICDNGTGGPIVDSGGNNRLTFPAGGNGRIEGDVTFGGGNDAILMSSGTITGAVDQGDGRNLLEIHGGTIEGAVRQGGGVDRFVMSDGVIQSLTQGSSLDFAEMSGGRIIGLFFAGDFFTMTGGRIGEVDLEQGNNEMRMSAGTIDGNVSARQNNDLLELSGGSIGGAVDLGNGINTIRITGGSIGGDLLTRNGTDSFTWDGAGTIAGAVRLGDGNDSGILRNLSEATLSSTPAIDGGLGNDALTFDKSNATTAGRYLNWENVALTNSSRFTLDRDFVLGDSGTATGAFTIDGSSRLLAGNGANAAIRPFAAGQHVAFTNAGTIDLANGATGPTDRLTIVGDYVGAGGTLLLETRLGDDSSPSDRLVIASGSASGSTGIGINNVGGAGASTTQNGILVVEAIQGGVTPPTAFSLNGVVAAGAHEYLLFRGGVTAGTANNWYLRSQLVAVPAPPPTPEEPNPPPPPAPVPAPESPPLPVPTPEPTPPAPPAPGQPVPPVPEPPTVQQPAPPTPGAVAPVAPIIELYRVEAPGYAVVPPAAHQLAMATLGTFHQRQGEQAYLQDNGMASAIWGRVFGGREEQGWSGTVNPTVDGSISGFQLGFDLIGTRSDSGHRDHAGVFFGNAQMNGDVRGFALGWNNLTTGRLKLEGISAGGYWTHIGPTGWYLDAVAMGTWFDGTSRSSRAVNVDLNGSAVTLSLEGGYPIPLGGRIMFEPQAQIIWQRQSFDDMRDAFSTIAFSSTSAFTGRIGGRLRGDIAMGEGLIQPYLTANIWHDFAARDTIRFAETDTLITQRTATALELGGGIGFRVSSAFSLYASGGYTTDIRKEKQDSLKGSLGVRISW